MTYYMNGIEWNVYRVHPKSDLLTRSNGTQTVGMCDRVTCCLYISDLLQGAFLRKVLIHEVCHSAMLSYDIDMSVEQEEIFCDLIASYGDEIIRVADDIFYFLKKAVA